MDETTSEVPTIYLGFPSIVGKSMYAFSLDLLIVFRVSLKYFFFVLCVSFFFEALLHLINALYQFYLNMIWLGPLWSLSKKRKEK